MAYKTNLGGATTNFSSMMKNGFGIVTVMNAYIIEALNSTEYKNYTPYDFASAVLTPNSTTTTVNGKTLNVYCYLDTLKVANVTQEGPTKTVSGGQFSNPLIKFGKSARLEMQDALGRASAISTLCGGIVESDGSDIKALHFGEDFVGPKMIIGDSFFIDQKSGQQVPVKVIFYQFLPDSIFNLTQDAEGDATVFDMNGDLLTTVVKIGDKNGDAIEHGLFYSIVDLSGTPAYTSNNGYSSEAEVNADAENLSAGMTIRYNGEDHVISEVKETLVDGVLTYTVTHAKKQ